jgi:signal transduction histidine kinase
MAYNAVIGVVAGVCLGFGILYLFIGYRRRTNKFRNLTFAVFALAYAATLLMGIGYHNANSVASFLALGRIDVIFVLSALVALIWFISAYTSFQPRMFLFILSASIVFSGLGGMLSPSLIYNDPVLTTLTLPWGEEIVNLEGSENIFGIIALLAQLATLGFIIVAGIVQFRRGERKPAVILLAGMSWFIIALFYEILGMSGLVTYVPLAETGFIGIALAMSLQMAGEVFRSEEELVIYRLNLENMVMERTVELEAAQAQLVDQATTTATFEERSRLARDLHDEVTQTIYSAALIAEVLPKVWARSPEEGERNLQKLRQLVRGALAELRTLLFELRPAALEAAQLPDLLHYQSDAFTGRTRIPVNLDVAGDGNGALPAKVKIGLFRIAQETLNNVAKHAGATRVNIALQQSPDEIQLMVVDNGRGFEPAEATADRMGLRMMGERADNLGMNLLVESKPGIGTQVSVTWLANGTAMGEDSADR